MKNLGSRIQALEEVPEPKAPVDPAAAHLAWVERAARCGMTEEEVVERYGGWPGMAVAMLVGQVVDPQDAAAEQTRTLKKERALHRHGGDKMAVLFEMLQGPAARRRA